jgi:UDP-N-acetylglucosamine 2-epimerase
LGVPTVNVGVRQGGRLRAPSVLDAEEDPDAIAAAITMAMSAAFRAAVCGEGSPYGDGHAAERIAEVLATVDLDALEPKRFHDLVSRPPSS